MGRRIHTWFMKFRVRNEPAEKFLGTRGACSNWFLRLTEDVCPARTCYSGVMKSASLGCSRISECLIFGRMRGRDAEAGCVRNRGWRQKRREKEKGPFGMGAAFKLV